MHNLIDIFLVVWIILGLYLLFSWAIHIIKTYKKKDVVDTDYLFLCPCGGNIGLGIIRDKETGMYRVTYTCLKCAMTVYVGKEYSNLKNAEYYREYILKCFNKNRGSYQVIETKMKVKELFHEARNSIPDK